ncbi:MAG: low molecular weight protein arginine phosphatase [Clostridia bacterium]|nr:low molecular weight protein arginine phosphatase [Clostridia bacterium]
MNIMFICTGNICRSAMAHWLFEKKLEEKRIGNIQVFSSGIYASIGDTPTYEAKRVMEEYGVNMKHHRATNTRYSDIEKMDLILCATASHKNEVINMYPNLKDKVFTMKEYVNYNREYHDSINIKDPWGYDIDTYRSCIAEIDECLNLLIEKILEERNKNK